jgi:FtsP/CotA-like multicopper oxidase with cupredoxin domain
VIRGRIAAVGLGVLMFAAACSSTNGTAPAPSPANSTTREYPATGATKTIELTITEFDWEVAPGAIYQAIGYNGAIPGPTIDVNAGDHVVIKLTNKATAPHSVHTHVVRFANGSDGVTKGVANPGETVTVEWDAVFAGTFPYHDHAGAAGETDGVSAGLFGALVVHAPDERKAAQENVILLSDFDTARYSQLPGVAHGDAGPNDAGSYRGGHQYMHTVNGRAYEEWSPHFQAKLGDLVRWRVISIGQEFHTFHVHGHRWVTPEGVLTDNVTLGPGTYTTFDWTEDNVGDWLYHCHVPAHMEGGMVGLYTVSQ